MRALLVATCFWPGLPRLWCRGEWSSLAAAVAFSGALNLVLLASFVWPELLPSSLVVAGWLLVLTTCLISALRAYRQWPELLCAAGVDERGLFIRAQGEYLKGHWYEAECLLQQLLSRSPHDVDAGLMLATLYRHTRRYDEALAWLGRLDRLEAAERWQWEIERERQLNADAAGSAADELPSPPNSDNLNSNNRNDWNTNSGELTDKSRE